MAGCVCVEIRWSLSSFPSQTVLWCYDTLFLWYDLNPVCCISFILKNSFISANTPGMFLMNENKHFQFWSKLQFLLKLYLFSVPVICSFESWKKNDVKYTLPLIKRIILNLFWKTIKWLENYECSQTSACHSLPLCSSERWLLSYWTRGPLLNKSSFILTRMAVW